MRILAIETSCDETSIALVECEGGLKAPRFNIVQNIVSSQIPVHRPFGGVVPNLAKREHIKNLPIVLKQILELKSYVPQSGTTVKQLNSSNSSTQSANRRSNSSTTIDLIAVTVGPGLEPALWTGIEFAKQLRDQRLITTNNKRQKKIPLVGANHLKGHLYSFLASQGTVNSKHDLPAEASTQAGARSTKQIRNSNVQDSKRFGFRYSDFEFPAIALLVSGGHTILLKLDSLTKWKKLGETRDDAAGEAFDKVARMMGLPYPGGPEIAKLALKGNPKAINFPRPMLNVPRKSASSPQESASAYDFSFSGLKTSVLYYLRDNPKIKKEDVAASFQEAVVDVLAHKTMRAAQEYGAKSVVLCGGVAANKALRANLRQATNDLRLNFFVPPNDLNGDNAAMIAIAAYIDHLKKAKPLKMEARGNLSI